MAEADAHGAAPLKNLRDHIVSFRRALAVQLGHLEEHSVYAQILESEKEGVRKHALVDHR